jgi:hypothetical protein
VTRYEEKASVAIPIGVWVRGRARPFTERFIKSGKV